MCLPNGPSCRTKTMLNPWYLRPVDGRTAYHNYNNNKDNELLSYVAATGQSLPPFLTGIGVDVGLGVGVGVGESQTCLPYFGMEMPSTAAVKSAHKSLPDFLIPLHEIMFQHHYQQQQQQRQPVATTTTTAGGGSTMGTLINSLPRETFASSNASLYATKSLTPQQQQRQQQPALNVPPTTAALATRPRHNGEHLFVRHFHERDRLIREHQLQQQRLRDEQEQEPEAEQQHEQEQDVNNNKDEQQQQQHLEQRELESNGHNNHWHGVVYDGNANAMTAPTSAITTAAATTAAAATTTTPQHNGNVVAALAVVTPLTAATASSIQKESNIYEPAKQQPNGQHRRDGNPASPTATTTATTTTMNKGKSLSLSAFSFTSSNFLYYIY